MQSVGIVLPSTSLVWGQSAGRGTLSEQHSAISGAVIHQMHLLGLEELGLLIEVPGDMPIPREELWEFAERLASELDALAPLLLETMQHETGFIRRDCTELLAGTLGYLRGFRAAIAASERAVAPLTPYQLADGPRQIRLVRSSWNTVAVILPQNAFLLVAVTALLNVLAAGNRVILRPPQQSARSAALFMTALRRSNGRLDAISVVFARSRDFVEALHRSRQSMLIHYMGSSQHAATIIDQGFRAAQRVLVDGSGNCWVWIDASVSLDTAVDLLTAGATRYNGQTCSSINGAIIHPSLWQAVCDRLADRWRRLRAGDPVSQDVDVGPLFDEGQAEWCQQQLLTSGGTVLAGGKRAGNLLEATLIACPDRNSGLVAQGIFGPGLWIMPGEQSTFIEWWAQNRYTLCAGVLSAQPALEWWLARLTGVARLSVNGDPSVEHIFEPWGGYPESGSNPVSIWLEKYQRVVAIEEPAP